MDRETAIGFWATEIEDAEMSARIEIATLERMRQEGFPVRGEQFTWVWQRRDARIATAQQQLDVLYGHVKGDAA